MHDFLCACAGGEQGLRGGPAYLVPSRDVAGVALGERGVRRDVGRGEGALEGGVGQQPEVEGV